MLNNLIFNAMLIVCLITWNLHGCKGLRWCGDSESLETYGLDKICCKKKLFSIVDDHKRRRGCCSNILYYIDDYACVDGKLHSVNPPDSLPPDPTRARTKEPNVRLSEMQLFYRLRQIHMTSNSDQHIMATVAELNRNELNMPKRAKWRKLKRIRIYMDQSLYRKYVGKTVFVYSDKNLTRENSLHLSARDILI